MRNTVPSSRSGAYRYERDGVDAGVNETFTRVQDNAKSRRTVSKRVTPSGVTLDVRAVEELGEGGWRVRAAEITLQSDPKSPESVSVLTTWERTRDMLHVTRRIVRPNHAMNDANVDGAVDEAVEDTEDEAVVVGESALLSPLLRVFQGDVICELARRSGSHTTVVPWLLDPTNTDQLLRPIIEARSASQLAPNTYVYTGGPYHDEDRFLIDDDGTLTSYRFRSPDGAQWAITRVDDDPQ